MKQRILASVFGASLALGLAWSSSALAQGCVEFCTNPDRSEHDWECFRNAAIDLGYDIDGHESCAEGLPLETCAECTTAAGMGGDACIRAVARCTVLRAGPLATFSGPGEATDLGLQPTGTSPLEPRTADEHPTDENDETDTACADNEDCTCPSGQTCTTTCTIGSCGAMGESGSVLVAMCPGGGCRYYCGPGVQCTFSCAGGGCTMDVATGVDAAATCSGGSCYCTGIACRGVLTPSDGTGP